MSKRLYLAIILAVSCAPTAFAAASDRELKRAVALDIQSLLEDTVNEGEQTAHVIYQNGEPNVECKLSNNRQQRSKKWAFCYVDFKVEWEGTSDTRTCGLLYAFDSKNPSRSLTRGNEDLFGQCVEYLGESIE